MPSTATVPAASGSQALSAYETLYQPHVEKPQPPAEPKNVAATQQPRAVLRRRYRRTVTH